MTGLVILVALIGALVLVAIEAFIPAIIIWLILQFFFEDISFGLIFIICFIFQAWFGEE